MTNPHPWWRTRLAGFDIETTGADTTTDRVITAALVTVPGTLRPQITTWVIDPGIPVSEEATEVNHWTNERLQAHPRVMQPVDALFQITGWLALHLTRGTPVVAMNAPFDFSLLEVDNRRHHLPTLAERLPNGIRPILDPYVLDKHVDQRRKGKRKLTDLCDLYGVMLGAAHTADADALAAVRLTQRIIDRHPALSTQTAEALHDLQVGWRHQQMTSLRAYFDRVGKPHDGCNPGWPIYSPTEVEPQATLTGTGGQ